MKRTFCDRCGAEIDDREKHATITGHDFKHDFCSKCAVVVKEMLDHLKAEMTKQ